ncbi:MAG: MATE family efflux transporter [Bacteroidales bacterium]|nr:MATE family efflux transporter [Bacteroidales bacterium]
MAQNIITVTDTAFLGRVGEVALGASAIGGIFYLAIAMLGWGFGIGTQIIISRRYGEKKLSEIGLVVEHSLYFLIPLAILMFILIFLVSGEFLGFILKSGDIQKASNEYLQYRLFGILFAYLNMAFRALYIGIGRTKVISWTTIVMAVVNILFDYLLIFGKFGFPELGIKGAAIASVMAEFAAMLTFIIYIRLDKKLIPFRIFKFQFFSKRLYFRIIKVASPMMLQNFFSIGVWFLFFVLVESLGEHALAISNIIRSVYVVIMLPIWGFSSATNTLIGWVIGQGREDEVMRVLKKVINLSFFSVLLLIGLILIAPEKVLSIYTNNMLLIRDALPVLYVVSGSAMFIAVGFILFSGVSGTGKTNVSLALEIGILSIYLAYSYSLIKFFDITVAQIWTVEYIYGGLLAILSYLYLRSGRWKGHGV